jgi:hypothetical protein
VSVTAPATPPTTATPAAVTGTAPGRLPPPRGSAPGRRRAGPRRAAFWVLLVALLVLVAVVAGLSSLPTDNLDPASAGPGGTRALAQLLAQRGLSVQTTRTPTAAAGQTTVVAFPATLSGEALAALVRSAAGGTVLLVGADATELQAAGLGAAAGGGSRPDRARAPGCSLPAARTAGNADLGGQTYRGGELCYDASLSVRHLGAGTLILLGDATPLTNAALARDGDAALTVGLLDSHRQVRWLLAPAAGTAAAVGAQRPLSSFLPHRLVVAVAELALAVVLLALVRGRRLGPPVSEPLPVTVPATETALGRARLYQAARARDPAAQALRAGTRDRLGRRLATTDEQTLVARVAQRSGRDPGAVAALLYGAGSTTTSDTELVALAAELSLLDRQVPAL